MDFGFGFKSGGAGSSYAPIVETTYADLQTLIAASGLTAGTFYKVTDRGDRWIMFQAVSTSKLAEDGVRLMLCPADYAIETDAYSNVWLGVWNASLTPSSNNLVIWGGLVWRSQQGNIGTAIDDVTLSADWVVIPKDSFANHEYIEMLFGCQYDFTNDCFVKQWDNKNNIITYSLTEDSYNGCNITDWNYATSGYRFESNSAHSIFNNSISGDIAFNTSFLICNNKSNVTSISYNNVPNIINNNNVGDIITNFGLFEIWDNTNAGGIYGNHVISQIYSNSNTGAIYDNYCYDISSNENTGYISNNYNNGSISLNSNGGDIINNSNNGSISSNSNSGMSGDISYNTNLGDINENSNAGLISYNSNSSIISTNTNNGYINYNNNLGVIEGNSNDGYISHNNNSGGIYSCSSGEDSCSIYYNINNGYISGTFAADVSDAEVNKT
jgi:hypothetical protein